MDHNRPMIPSSRHRGALLLADISGYTSFLGGVADAHRALIIDAQEPPAAYAVLSHLLDRIVFAIGPSFQLAKLEGDAVFAVSEDPVPTGESLLAAVRGWYGAFRDALGEAISQWICTCDACVRVGDLDLKFVLHHGSWINQSIAGSRELVGPDVNVAHRLLKNHVRDVIGVRPYALFTEAAIQALDIPLDGMASTSEAYDDAPPIAAHVLVLA